MAQTFADPFQPLANIAAIVSNTSLNIVKVCVRQCRKSSEKSSEKSQTIFND
jgi:hypothetical protein